MGSHRPGRSTEPLAPVAEQDDNISGASQPSTAPDMTERSSTVWEDMLLQTLGSNRQHGANLGASAEKETGEREDPRIGIDIRNWVPEPSDVSPLGLAGSLFETILNLCTSISQQLARTRCSRRLHSELERYFLWGDGFSASQGYLDEILAKSTELRQAVLSSLYELGKVVKDDLLRVANNAVRDKQHDDSAESVMRELAQSGLAKELQRLLDETASLLDTPEAMTDFESLSDDGSTRYDLDDVLDDVAIYIDCLMDLSLALENPAVDLEPRDQAHQDIEVFDVSTPQELTFCRRIRDRFPKMRKFLVERLSRANSARATKLQALREVALEEVEVVCEPEESIYDPSEQIFSESDPRMTVTSGTYSSQRSQSIFDRPLRFSRTPGRSRNIAEDAQSFASFSTSYSAITEGRPRVPPLPDEAVDGQSFRCLACHQTLSGITTRNQWKKHIFDDLEPYVCTFQNCTLASTLYGSSMVWATHEATHRTKAWSVEACLFCGKEKKNSTYAMHYKHLAEHMREVSLAVLPSNLDDDENESDDMSGQDSIQEGRGSQAGLQDPASTLGTVGDDPLTYGPEGAVGSHRLSVATPRSTDIEPKNVEPEPDNNAAPVNSASHLVEINTEPSRMNDDPEEEMLKLRAKFFVFNREASEWRELGTSTVRILKHKENQKSRLVVRRDRTLAVSANHYIVPDIKLSPNVGSDRSWVWSVAADVSSGEPQSYTFAARFANSELANVFKAAFIQAQKDNEKLSDLLQD